jgi:ABC-2 type transport system permease protein
MSTAVHDRAADRAVDRAVVGLAVRQVGRGAAIVAVVAAGMSALVVATYRGLVASGDDAAALAALAGNPAIRTLFGTPLALDDPGGFAVWRTGTPLAVLVAAWAMVTATRVTRGEEDAGRWNLLLAGRTTLAAVVVRHVAVLAAGAVVTGAAVCAALVATGTSAAGAVLFGCGLALVGVFFAGTGAVCAQVFSSRTAATGAGTAVLGIGLLARMAGDGSDALAGLRWVSPFGLLTLSRPFAGDRWGPLLLLGVSAAAVAVAATALARRRDVGAGLLTLPSVRTPRPWLLGSVGAFAVRTALGVTVGWSVALGAYFLLIGALAGSLTAFLADNPRFTDLAAQAGFTGLDRVDGYAATLFAVAAVPIGMYTVVRTARLGTEESDRRLTLLLATPVTRIRILAADAAATLGGAAVLLAVVAGATWAGAATTGTDLGLGAALAGTGNTLPIVVLSLAAALFALGAAPRLVGVVGAVPAAGGFLVRTLAPAVDAPGWVDELSPFSHLAPVPLTAPNWFAGAVMLTIAVALAGAGAVTYRRRDMRF